jgi:hypothetical protein
MGRCGMRRILLFLLAPILIISLVGISCTASDYKNPPLSLQESDLLGLWETHYGQHQTDSLILRDDGTYKQTFTNTDYTFETDWNQWWLDYFPDGRVYIHFDQGRYYLYGIRIAELDGLGDPCPIDFPDCYWGNHPRIFYDPYAKEGVEMPNELVLTIRVDTQGEIIFHHMWVSSDQGFAIIGGQSELFRRVENLDP